LSDANSQMLSFACPKCQKKLKAPSKLAGQKLSCPKCSSPIRVPGVVQSKNDDDDWLELNSPPESPSPRDAKKPVLAKLKPVHSESQIATPSQNEPPKLRDLGDLDELRLAPPQELSSSNSPSAKTPSGMSLFDDDLPDLQPIDDPSSSSSKAKEKPLEPKSQAAADKVTPAKPFLDLPDIALPDLDVSDFSLAPLEPAKSKTINSKGGKSPVLSGSLEELSLESPAWIGPLDSIIDEEFSFPCKLCGSLLCSTRSQVGHQIRCPDCYSEFDIPSPPQKKKKAEVNIDAEVAKVTFAPIDSLSVHGTNSSSEKTKEILDRAEQTLESEREEYQDLSGTFDTKRWIGFLFGFLKDPLVITAAIGLGFVCGFWLFAMAAMGTWVGLEGAQALIAQLVILCVFGIPIFGAICMCGIAILTMAANRESRVTEWPFLKMSESIGECVMVLASVIAASIPGGMLGAVFRSLNAHPMVSFAFIMLGIWAITPILLLCMIDTSSIFQPFSKAVFQSIKSRAEAWGAMYMQTGMAFASFFMLMVLTGTAPPVGDFVLGLALPFISFFMFNQYGVLAGRISDVTEMGFEGDFSAD
jgi:DNA-directed RNA polymerase subunit M/transcription elongation factor TFIIS